MSETETGYQERHAATVAALAAARTELSRLRGVVEAVQAAAGDLCEFIEDMFEGCTPSRGCSGCEALRKVAALRAALAPVSSSGEAESGALIPCCEHCGCPGNDRSGHDDTCRNGCNDPAPVPSGEAESGGVWGTCDSCSGLADLRWSVEHTANFCPSCYARENPAPVPSGGQADGEGVVDVDAWAARHLGLAAARPVLSCEEIRTKLGEHGIYGFNGHQVRCLNGSCGWLTQSDYLDHLADVLTAGGEQRG